MMHRSGSVCALARCAGVLCWLGLLGCGKTTLSHTTHDAGRVRDAGALDAGVAAHDSGARDARADVMHADAAAVGVDAGNTGGSALDAGVPSCEEQSVAITMQAVLAASGADTACSADTDCLTLRPLHNRCYSGCTVPVSKAGQAIVRDALAQIDLESCPMFAKSGCTVAEPKCPQPPLVTCQAGRCTAQIGVGAETCDDLRRRGDGQIMQASAAADSSCMTAADCTVQTESAACIPGCGLGTYLSRAGARSVRKAVDAVTLGICPASYAIGCTSPELPPCPPPPEPLCIQHVCSQSDIRL